MTTKSTVTADFGPMLSSLQKATDAISKLGADAQSKMAAPVAESVRKLTEAMNKAMDQFAAISAAMDKSAVKSKDAAKSEDSLSKEIREAGNEAEKAAGKVNKLAEAEKRLAAAGKRAAHHTGQPASTSTSYGTRYLDLENDPIAAVRADRARREAERKAAGRARAAQGRGVPLTQLSGAKVKRLIPKAVVPETVVEAVTEAAVTEEIKSSISGQNQQASTRQNRRIEQLAERAKRDQERARMKREKESARLFNKDHAEAIKMDAVFEKARQAERKRQSVKSLDPYASRSNMLKVLSAQGLGDRGAQRFFDLTLGQRSGVERMISQGNLNSSPLWMRGDQEDFLRKSYDQLLAKAKSEGLSLEAAIKSLVDARREEISAIKNTEKAAESAAKATQKKAEADLKSSEKRKVREAYDLDRAHAMGIKENRTFDMRAERRRQAQIAATQARYVRRSQAISSLSPIGSNWFAGPLGGAVTRLGGIVPSSSAAFVARHSVTGLLAGHAVGGLAQRGVGVIGSLAGQGLAKIGGSMGGVLGGVVGGGLGIGVPVAGQLLGATMNALITYQATKISAAVLAGVKIIQTAFKGLSAAFGLIKNALMGIGRFLLSWGPRGIAGAGVAGVAAIAHGARSFATEEKSLVGMRVVARGAAPGMEALADKLNKNSIFSKSDLIEGIKQGLAFGLAPAQITKFLPKMMDSAALFGEDIGQGLRALTRAAFQAEPEAAERYGLNLYEKNLKAQFGDRFDLENPAQKVAATLAAADIQLQRFSGGMEKALQTVNGTFLYLKNKVNDTFVNLGKGFSQGFDLTGRTRAMGERFAQPRMQGLAYGIGNTVGGLLGQGADYLAKSMPSMDNVISFFSKKDEGDVWSQRGDALKAFAAQAIAVFQMIGEQARAAFTFLTDPAGELAQGLNNIIQSFVANGWVNSSKQMVAILCQELNQLNDWADQFAIRMTGAMSNAVAERATGMLYDIGKGILFGIGNAAKNNPGTTIAGAVGAGLGGWGGSYIGMPMKGAALGAAITAGAYRYLAGEGPANQGGLQKFSDGGTVDAPEGKAVPAIVHGGEMILNREQQKEIFGKHMYAKGTVTDEQKLKVLRGSWLTSWVVPDALTPKAKTGMPDASMRRNKILKQMTAEELSAYGSMLAQGRPIKEQDEFLAKVEEDIKGRDKTMTSQERTAAMRTLSLQELRQYDRVLKSGAGLAQIDAWLKEVMKSHTFMGLGVIPNPSSWPGPLQQVQAYANAGIDKVAGYVNQAAPVIGAVAGAEKQVLDQKSAAALPSVEDFFDQGAQALQKAKAGAPGHKGTGYMSGSPMKMGSGAAGLGGKPTGYMASLQKEAMKYFQQMQAQQAYSGLVNRFFMIRQLTTDPMGERMGFANPVGHPMARLFANSRNPMAQMINMQRAMMDAAMYMQGGRQGRSSNIRLDPKNPAHVKYFNDVWNRQQGSAFRDAVVLDRGTITRTDNDRMDSMDPERRENVKRKMAEKRYQLSDRAPIIMYGNTYVNNIDESELRMGAIG